MTEQHPIPPPELVEELQDLGNLDAIRLAYQAGADQELEACCEWLDYNYPSVNVGCLRTARRPKPPSLRESALAALGSIERGQDRPEDTDTIRRALEALPE